MFTNGLTHRRPCRFTGLTLLYVFLLCACGTPEVLLPREAAAPSRIDFSGLWRIRPDEAGSAVAINDAIRRTAGQRQSRRQQVNSANPRALPQSSRGSRAGQAHIFLEIGESLKITQTAHAIFISFDRAIVEEFRFGENRLVNIGEIEAQRVSGWDGDQYVVETLGKNRMKLTERFLLLDGGDTLQRRLIFRSKDLEEVIVVQTFDLDTG